MALSLSNFLYSWLAFLLLTSVSADTVTYDFTMEWLTRNPDGMADRPVIGINGQWPVPRMEATVGDRVVVNVNNQLGNQSTSLHFHGLFMNGTNEMDGPVGVTQCPIPPGSKFTYNFTITQPGTYWYHSHIDGQYPDGLRGPLIVHDPKSPYRGQYDQELVVTLSDWYHDQIAGENGLLKSFLSVTNPSGAEPVPKSALMNDTQNLQIDVQPGTTYLMRLVNIGAFAGQYFWIEDHTFRIVEVDGVWTEAAETDMIYVAVAQRYAILVTTKNSTSTNYAMIGSMDETLFDTVPDSLNPNVTSFLVYNSAQPMPTAAFVNEFAPYDDVTLIPSDRMPLLPEPDFTVNLDVVMDNLGDGKNYAFFNDITYVRPIVPTLYTALTTGDLASDPTVYGVNTNPFVLGYNEVVEIVVNNLDTGRHPFHLHGFNFQAVARGEENAGNYNRATTTMRPYPMRRDTFLTYPLSHIVMRFRSDNPGIWLFHCHIEWHVDSGLMATMVAAPMQLQQQHANKTSAIPADHYAACAAASPAWPTAGNAAANTVDFLDLTGANVQPAPLPAGFTTRGIIALIFSCIAGFLGIAVVTWYGLGEMGEIEQRKEQVAVDAFAVRRGVGAN